MNERYGKVVNHNAVHARFGVRLEDGSTVAFRKENLEMGMKKEELSDEDEHMLLSLRSSPEKIRNLPFQERMAILYDCGEQHPFG